MGRCHSKSSMQEYRRRTSSTDLYDDVSLYYGHHDVTYHRKPPPRSVPSPRREKQDSPRVIFVSLVALWLQWGKMPSDILMRSIVVINASRADLFPKTTEDLRLSCDCPLSRFEFTPEFLQIIHLKDEQGLVIWMMENQCREESASRDPFCGRSQDSVTLPMMDAIPESKQFRDFCQLTAPISIGGGMSAMSIDDNLDSSILTMAMDTSSLSKQWRFISMQLSMIVDPSVHDLYQPLDLNEKSWKCRNAADFTYARSIDSVCNELLACDGNFKAMCEIFKVSNPSLIPMVNFDASKYESEFNKIRDTKSNAATVQSSQIDDKQIEKCIFPQLKNPMDCGIEYADFGDKPDENGWVWLHYFDDDL